MDSNSDLNRWATLCLKVGIQLFYGGENFPTSCNGIAGVTRAGVARPENRHEPVTQIFVYHPAMCLFNDDAGYPEKIVHHFDHVAWFRYARSCSPRTHVHEHDGDLFLDAAQSWVARQYLFGCAFADVQTKGLT